MIAEINIEQYRQLVGQEITDGWTFNPITMPSGRFFVSEEEIDAYQGQQFSWLKDLPLIDFDSTIPDTTPPEPMGMGVVIPSDYPVLKLFPDLEFRLNGFVVPIVEYNGGYAVDLAYLMWEAFRKDQDYGYNKIVFDTFKTLWYELAAKVQNNDIVQLSQTGHIAEF